ILLNSKSRHWPTGIANSSGQLGRNLCDHLYGESAYGYLPQLLGQPSFPDSVGDNTIVWMPRWQNLKDPHQEQFIRGYSVYPGGGAANNPGMLIGAEASGPPTNAKANGASPPPFAFPRKPPRFKQGSKNHHQKPRPRA